MTVSWSLNGQKIRKKQMCDTVNITKTDSIFGQPVLQHTLRHHCLWLCAGCWRGTCADLVNGNQQFPIPRPLPQSCPPWHPAPCLLWGPHNSQTACNSTQGNYALKWTLPHYSQIAYTPTKKNFVLKLSLHCNIEMACNTTQGNCIKADSAS